jgi:hypothetical protein
MNNKISIHLIATILFFFISHIANANEEEMNGYSLQDLGDFTNQWKLVTVRFRKDTNEMRFTYANETAWKVLSSGNHNYPNGSMFAKLALMTKEDPAFTSSAVPSGARRIQLMVRNSKLHTETGGWGYALFGTEGKVLVSDQKSASMACAACHSLVPERGFVFSQTLSITHFSLSGKIGLTPTVQFTDKKTKSLPVSIQRMIPNSENTIRSIQGNLSKYIFFGTLDEIRPILSQEVVKSKKPALLISDKNDKFSLVLIDPIQKCSENEVGLRGIHTIENAKNPFFEIKFCFQR